jgi:transposase
MRVTRRVSLCSNAKSSLCNRRLTFVYVRHILYYVSNPTPTSLAKRDSKAERLKQLGALNAHPERVRAPWFQAGSFFDARDLVQVKYEMLRQVSREGTSKAEAAALFGVSRPTFYQAEAAFARAGLSALLPQQRGPKGAHKLKPEAMAFIEQRMAGGGPMHARTLARQLELELGLSVHPRTIERAIARKKKR